MKGAKFSANRVDGTLDDEWIRKLTLIYASNVAKKKNKVKKNTNKTNLTAIEKVPINCSYCIPEYFYHHLIIFIILSYMLTHFLNL